MELPLGPVKILVPLAPLDRKWGTYPGTNVDPKCYISRISKQSFSYATSRRFEVFWPVKDRGTGTKIGVLTLDQPGHLLEDRRFFWNKVRGRWLWNLETRTLRHNQSAHRRKSYDFDLPDTFYMDLDMDKGTLRFVRSGQDLGVAFKKLKDKEVHLAFLAKCGVFDDLKVSLLTSDLSFD